MAKKSIALVGLDPFTVDFSNDQYTNFSHLGPDGLKALLDRDRDALCTLGFDAELVLLNARLQTSHQGLIEALRSKRWNCVMIGNGLRSIPINFLLFEVVVNLVHKNAPQASICFNTKPDDSVASVLRWTDPWSPEEDVAGSLQDR